MDEVRNPLRVHEGHEYSDETKTQVRQAVAAAIGKEPTDVDPVCCDDKGNTVLFIGLPGASSKAFAYNPESEGNEPLSAYIMNLYSRLDRAIEEAVRNGRPGAEEAYSNGYALMKDPTARSLQLAVRQWSLNHERELFRVLQVSSSAKDRRPTGGPFANVGLERTGRVDH